MTIRVQHAMSGECFTLSCDNGRIESITPTLAAADCWIAPAFCDVQINGALGRGFTTPALRPDDVRLIAETCRRHGIGTFFPTVITSAESTLRHALATLRASVDADPVLARMMPGFHLEGPYLCPDDGPRGAHPREHIREPSYEEFQRLQNAAGGKIRLVTLAPERTGAIRLIEQLVREGVVVAIGHTSATGARIRDAVSAGAKMSTHLGNGSHAMLPRHDNYIWEQLAADELWASVIADGHHLPAAVLKSVVRGKQGRVILTCDAGTFAGCAPGHYRDWGTELEVLPGGKIVLSGTPFLAGSGVFTDACVSEVMRATGASLAEAIGMASVFPRRLFGLTEPKLEAGGGPFVLFDWKPGGDVSVREVVDAEG